MNVSKVIQEWFKLYPLTTKQTANERETKKEERTMNKRRVINSFSTEWQLNNEEKTKKQRKSDK